MKPGIDYIGVGCGALIVNEKDDFEELGISIEIIEMLCIVDDILHDEDQHWVTPQFLCKIISGIPENKEPEKCSALSWFSLNNLPAPLNKLTQEAIAAYLKRKCVF